jgi:hypothetical protein
MRYLESKEFTPFHKIRKDSELMAQRESGKEKPSPSSFYQHFKNNPKMLNHTAFKSNFTPQIQQKQTILDSHQNYNKESMLREGVNNDLDLLDLSNSNTSSTLNDQKQPLVHKNLQK